MIAITLCEYLAAHLSDDAAWAAIETPDDNRRYAVCDACGTPVARSSARDGMHDVCRTLADEEALLFEVRA